MNKNLKKRILVACIHYPVCSGRYITRALRRMGHDVKTVGPERGNQVWGLEVDPEYAWTADAMLNFSNKGQPVEIDGHIGFIDSLLPGWTPELMITADSAFDLVGYRDEFTFPKVLYGVDNHVRDYNHGGLSWWDYKFLAHSNGYRMEDANTIHLPCAYDPAYFHRDKALFQRHIHATMIGFPYPRRAETMEAIGGVKTPDGQTKYHIYAALGKLGEQYNAIYNDSVVSVCLSAHNDLAQRVFETAAMGCVILADSVPDMEKLGFNPGEHYLPISGPEDAVQQMQALFDGPDERIAELAENAWRWAQPHTWDARCQVMLDTVFEGGE